MQYSQSSPGSYDCMIAWPVSCACFVACLPGEESQQPMWPQTAQPLAGGSPEERSMAVALSPPAPGARE